MLISACCPKERWKSVAPLGCPDYEVSSCGRVRNSRTGYLLALKPRGKGGYIGLRLETFPKGRLRISAHRLVLLIFVGPKPSEKHQAAHNDGCSTNNHKTNLRWATALENIRDKYKHGTMGIGSKNGRAKLTEETVIALRREYRFLLTGVRAFLKEKYGVKGTILADILSRKRWTHI